MQTNLLFDFDQTSSFKDFIYSLESSIKNQFGESVFTSWFKGLAVKSYDGENMIFSVPNEKIKNCIFLHYQTKFERILQKTFSQHFQKQLRSFAIEIEQNQFQVIDTNTQDATIKEQKSKFNLSIELDKKFTFANFLQSEENKLTVGFAKHFANLINSDSENILHFSKQFCICGSIGNGKTHLAQAIGNMVKSFGESVLYTTAERFLFNFQTAIQKNEGIEFTKSFLGVKLLIVDDIHFIATKKKTIEELNRVAYSVISSGGLVLFCSSSKPENLPIEIPSVKNFFASSHIINIATPSEDFRYNILKFKLEKSSYQVSDSILKTLAFKIQTNIRDLEGAMGRMVLHSQILNCEIGTEVSNFITTDIFPHKELKKFSVPEIQAKVAKYFGISVKEMTSKKRIKAILKARQVAIYLATQLTTLSYVEIGKLFNRTHSTVIHSIKGIKKDITSSPNFNNEINIIKIAIEQNI